jgi:hypothetical protein
MHALFEPRLVNDASGDPGLYVEWTFTTSDARSFSISAISPD